MAKLTAHAIDNHKEIGFHISDGVAVVDCNIPTPDRFNSLVVPRSERVRSVHYGLQAFFVPCQLPVFLERRLHDEAHVMRVCAARHAVDSNAPVPP